MVVWYIFLAAVGLYVLAGVVFAAAFVARGVSRVDGASASAPLGFRLLIFPGSTALWPWLLRRWIGAEGRAER